MACGAWRRWTFRTRSPACGRSSRPCWRAGQLQAAARDDGEYDSRAGVDPVSQRQLRPSRAERGAYRRRIMVPGDAQVTEVQLAQPVKRALARLDQSLLAHPLAQYGG